VIFGDDEMFRDPIRDFVAHLDQSGVDVAVDEEPGMFHVFPILMPWAEASRRAYRSVGAFVDRLLPPVDGDGAVTDGAPTGRWPDGEDGEGEP
jgi:monoterpene epsilon-lactone hydrolase